MELFARICSRKLSAGISVLYRLFRIQRDSVFEGVCFCDDRITSGSAVANDTDSLANQD